MKDIIVLKIEKEIERLLEEMSVVDVNSDDYEALISRLNNLYSTLHKEGELINNKDKNELEYHNEKETIEFKIKELRNTNLWSGLKTSVELVSVIAPLVFYGVWMNRGLEFEKEGSFTATTFKGLIGKFKPTK